LVARGFALAQAPGAGAVRAVTKMTITITLTGADGGTEVLAVHDGLPRHPHALRSLRQRDAVSATLGSASTAATIVTVGPPDSLSHTQIATSRAS
jgi:hypothetical protein